MSALSIRDLRLGEAPACERILRSLPEWFGIEESLLRYVSEAAALETIVAEESEAVVGFATIRRHNVSSAEIHAIAVLADRRGAGVGRAIVENLEARLRERRVEFLQVKTLGPSRPSAAYDRTRGFYMRLGFHPLEENALWGDANPCLILVKHLACGEDASATPRVLRVGRTIRASRERAWAAWMNREDVSTWFTTRAQIDARVGGRYSNADGDAGVFVALDPPRQIAFTWENSGHCPGTRVTVMFEPHGADAVDVILEHARLASAADEKDMHGGWSWALDSFASYLESGRPISHEDWLCSRRDSR